MQSPSNNPISTRASAIIEVRGVTKCFRGSGGELAALAGVDLEVMPGELVAVVGKSGSGKSTLLNLLAALDRPTTGEIRVAGTALHALSENEAAVWRGRNVGIVFQFFQLLPTLTVLENVMLPMDFRGVLSARERRARAVALLERVGVADQADKLPAELSGGQQQRVAIGRALANDPPVLYADEPTGNLDSATAAGVLQLFTELSQAGKTVVMVTHERDIGARVHRCVRLLDGAVAPESEACHA